VGFVVEKVALEQVFSEYFGFPYQFSFHRLFHIHHHLSFGAGTIGQIVADVQRGLSLTPPQEEKPYLGTDSPHVYVLMIQAISGFVLLQYFYIYRVRSKLRVCLGMGNRTLPWRMSCCHFRFFE
jgi:hypothetical protein